MANPNILDWLDENSERAYPLSEFCSRVSDQTTILPDTVILDAQLLYGAEPAEVLLQSVAVSGGTATFTITGQSNFTCSTSGVFPKYLVNADNSLLVVGVGISTLTNGTLTFTNLKFEPSVLFEFSGPWLGVSSITFPTSDALVGELDFLEGYQFNIVITPTTITLGADNLYGTPIGCTSFGTDESDCTDIISTIGGISGDGLYRTFITAGPGITVLDDPENHRIYVGYYFSSIGDVCKDIPPYPVL